jgi:hypothetical protein
MTYGVFRSHAYFYFFILQELRNQLTDADRRELLDGLRSGCIAPRLIFLDKDLCDSSPEVTAFLRRNYEGSASSLSSSTRGVRARGEASTTNW